MSFKIVLGLMAVVYLVVALSTAVTMTPEDLKELENKKIAANNTGGKNIKDYIASIWGTKITPEFEKNALDINQAFSELKKDPKAFGEKYGRRGNSLSPYNFIIKGTAKISSVNIKSSAGYLELDIEDLSGKNKVRMQIGPIIKKSVVRDSLPFFDFNNYQNQIEFAKVSKEINNYIKNNVVKGFNKADLEGKEVEFVGAFTYSKKGKVLITPVVLKLKGDL